MKFSEVPNLSKFEKFASENPDNEVVGQAYSMVATRLDQVEEPAEQSGPINPHGPEQLLSMKDRCAAIEESTRIIWACAAATDNLIPAMWEEGAPDFQEALDYFWSLPDLEWMDLTHHYRVTWENRLDRY